MNNTPVTGKTLIAWGYEPAPWFGQAIDACRCKQMLAPTSDEDLKKIVESCIPKAPEKVPMRHVMDAPFTGGMINLAPENDDERKNLNAVIDHMIELARVPTVKAAAIMPDACPAGSAPGTIPVGGVVAAENAIHPGMHSADICCSMAVSMFKDDIDPTQILDAGMKLSHFGPGGRPYSFDMRPPDDLMDEFESNPFLRMTSEAAIKHFGTQGDGNHFFFVGRVASTGRLALVTHHGSRKPGALLYKAGMACAERHRRLFCPEAPKHNAWIPADSEDGESYWAALQLMRRWTKKNHFAIHDAVVKLLGLKVGDRFWNEHNFVFQKSDGLFYHAKGATPAFPGFAADDMGLTLIPLNMAEPVLITKGLNAPNGLGFAPHGAGRNMSRTKFVKGWGDIPYGHLLEKWCDDIDVRFYCGEPDISELPGAYKDATSVRSQIERYALAEVVDTIEPIGSIMAGNWQTNAPWRNK